MISISIYFKLFPSSKGVLQIIIFFSSKLQLAIISLLSCLISLKAKLNVFPTIFSISCSSTLYL